MIGWLTSTGSGFVAHSDLCAANGHRQLRPLPNLSTDALAGPLDGSSGAAYDRRRR
jgi:hypothetical protein